MTDEQARAPMGEEGGGELAHPGRREFDLAERTALFGEAVIRLAAGICRDDISGPVIRQLVRSATSIGANYTEADEAGSKKEFRYRISVCCREARETQYWLRMLASAAPQEKDAARQHWKEANELTRIFGVIHRNSRSATH
jgi:four helix bundle protein